MCLSLSNDAQAIETGLGDWMALENKALPLTGLSFVLASYLAYINVSAISGLPAEAAHYQQAAAALIDEINRRFLDQSSGKGPRPAPAAWSQTSLLWPTVLRASHDSLLHRVPVYALCVRLLGRHLP